MKPYAKQILLLFIVLLAQFAIGQVRSVSGLITDNEGLPLPGATVQIKGSKTGTQTNIDGKYSIKASPTDTLIFSYLGMKSSEQKALSQTINVKMLTDATLLKSVVVTALGLQREKKSLGYSSEQLNEKELKGGASTPSISNLLAGKIAGLEVSRNNNFGGSTNVVIRGNKSLTGNNQALWVIDGVPMDNSNSNTNAQKTGAYGYDYGNTISDINQEDIESINVLKGAAATVLYGSRASNGVIVVSTKKAKTKDGRIGFTLSSGATIGTIDKSTFPTYQNKYGSGYGIGTSFYQDSPNIVNSTNDASYGDPFDNRLVYQWDAFTPYSPNFNKPSPWAPAKNGPVRFFKVAKNFTNSLTLEKSTEHSTINMSYVNTNLSGILPNSSLRKNQFSGRFSQKINEKLSVNAYAAISLQNTVGRNSTGYNDNILGSFRQWWQVNTDIKSLEQVYRASGGQNITWNWSDPTRTDGLVPIYWDNPYFTRYQNFTSDARNRLFSYASLQYKITSFLSVLGRLSLDTYNELQEQRRAVGSIAASFGLSPRDEKSGYQKNDISYQELNYDFILTFNKKIGGDLALNGVLGGNIRRTNLSTVLSSTIGGLVSPGLYALSNSRYELPFPIEELEKTAVNGLYTQGNFAYLDTYFVDASLRRDVSSTLPKGKNSYIYPALSAAFVVSNVLKVQALNLAKLRLNYAEVGNDAPALSLSNTYVRLPNFQGQPLNSVPATNKNPNLRPERTKSLEIGLESSFMDGRLGMDVTLYKTNTIDQILATAVSSASSARRAFVNGGNIQNQGIELQLTASPIKTADFSWDISLNWSKNSSKVVSLPEGVENLQLAEFQGGVTLNATPGEAYGNLKGTDYVYTNGQKTVNQTTGKYLISDSSTNIIGNITPKWMAGIRNKCAYKNISLSFLIDSQYGGDVFSLDMYYGLSTGLYKETAQNREGTTINPGVAPDGSTNKQPIINPGAYSNVYGYTAHPNKAFIYDASYIKLREVSINYLLPKSILSDSFLDSATLSLLGSNLWIIYKNLPYADPESGLSSGNTSRGYSTGSLPTTRDIGFNLSLKF